jgi:predicted DNA-binding transcriptional regulator AlpA
MEKRLRFADLQAANLVTNRVTLKNWIDHLGFPPGQLTGPNTRTWGEGEIQQWVEDRPTASKPTPRPEIVRRGRPRKAHAYEG